LAHRGHVNGAAGNLTAFDTRNEGPGLRVRVADADNAALGLANRAAALLSQMFRFGVHRDLVEASPVQLLYRPGGKERPKDRTLSDTEIKALLANLG
jgi:hypothetical protein